MPVSQSSICRNYLTNLYPFTNFSNPTGMAVDAYGFVYIADTGNNCILKFNSDGMLIASWVTKVMKMETFHVLLSSC